jgi:hypothetical protein
MYSINDDVLRRILDFMSPEDVHRINLTNRVVYEKSMKSRYECLEITKKDKPTKALLTHLWYVFAIWIPDPVLETLITFTVSPM